MLEWVELLLVEEIWVIKQKNNGELYNTALHLNMSYHSKMLFKSKKKRVLLDPQPAAAGDMRRITPPHTPSSGSLHREKCSSRDTRLYPEYH